MENTNPDVSGNSSPVSSEAVQTQTQLPAAPVVTAIPVATPSKGSQTPSENLYAALAEERRLRKEAEDKLNNLNTTVPTEDVYSDEGRLLQGKISSLEAKLAALEEEKELERVLAEQPLLKDKLSEFNEFRQEYPRHKLANVAKLFLAEKDLLAPRRTGLENPTGGPRGPVDTKPSYEELEDLRKNNFGKYRELIKKGII